MLKMIQVFDNFLFYKTLKIIFKIPSLKLFLKILFK